MSLFIVLILGISTFLYGAECSIYYSVKRGDTLWDIAKKFKLSLRELYRMNPELKKKRFLRPGDRVCVAQIKKTIKKKEKKRERVRYVIYRVKRGDSLIKIAKRFGVSVREIKRANNLKGNLIRVGQKLRIPVKERVAVSERKARTKSKKRTDRTKGSGKYVKVKVKKTVYITYRVRRGDTLIKIARKFRTSVRAIKRANRLKGNLIRVGQRLRIPVKREVFVRRYVNVPRVSLDFFPVDGRVIKNKRGVLIYTDCGKPVRAVADGKVIYSGDDLSAYGNVIILDHGKFVTVYAFNSVNEVRKGQRVKKGQKIGEVGIKPDEGKCALHFEVRSPEGNLLNPLEYVKSR